MADIKQCGICEGRGEYQHEYGLKKCSSCAGTGKDLDLGQLSQVKVIQGQAYLDIEKITGEKLFN